MFGFYTDVPEVFEQRVAEIEADMDEVDAGIEDPEKWIQVDGLQNHEEIQDCLLL